MYINQLQARCKKMLESGGRVQVMLRETNFIFGTPPIYGVVIFEVHDTHRKIIGALPTPTLSKEKALKWVDDIVSYDCRIENACDNATVTQ